MKKNVKSFFLGMIFMLTILCGITVFASSTVKSISALINTLTVKINGQLINSNSIVYNGNAYIQADKIANALNKTYSWDKKKNLIVISDKTLNTQSSAVSSKPSDSNTQSNPIDFTNIVVKSEMGTTVVYGEAKNNDNKQHSFTLKVSFYDKSRKLLGTAIGSVNDINGNSTKLFTAMGMDDYSNADSYKVQIDTMVDTRANINIPIEFSNLIIKSDSFGTTIEGEAKNNDSKVHSCTILVGIYDSKGKLLGIANGAINDLQGGDTKTFTTMSTDTLPDNVSLKVQVDTMVQ